MQQHCRVLQKSSALCKKFALLAGRSLEGRDVCMSFTCVEGFPSYMHNCPIKFLRTQFFDPSPEFLTFKPKGFQVEILPSPTRGEGFCLLNFIGHYYRRRGGNANDLTPSPSPQKARGKIFPNTLIFQHYTFLHIQQHLLGY